MTARTIRKPFFDAVQLRDLARARTYLDDNMTFAGLFENYPNANAYIIFTQFMQIVARFEVNTARAQIELI